MRRQRGFGAIAAIVVLVILAALAAAIVSISSSQHITSAQDVMSARVWQAARAGNEWGLYRALQAGQAWKGAACDWNMVADTANTQSVNLDLTAATGVWVTVYCDAWLYAEGESSPGTSRAVRLYRIRAVACPAEGCPVTDATVASLGYVERTRVVLATDIDPN